MREFRVPIRIVFYQKAGNWFAHCLEFDLLGDGPDKVSAGRALVEAIDIQIAATAKHDNHRHLFSPGDPQFFEMFAAGKDIGVGISGQQFYV